MQKLLRPERVILLLFYGLALLLAGLVFMIFRPFLVALGWAAVLAVLCYPWTERLKQRWGPMRAAAAGTAGVTLVLIAPALLLMFLFAVEGMQAARNLQGAVAAGNFDWISRDWARIARMAGVTGYDLPDVLRDASGRAGAYVALQFGVLLTNVADFLFKLFVSLFALFYFILDGDAIMIAIREILPFDEPTREQILSEANGMIHASVRVGLVLAIFQGLVGGVAFASVGIGSPVFWGIVMAFLALLPVIGTWPILVPAVIWLFATGRTGGGLVLLGVCGGLLGVIDSVLRPALLRGAVRLNGLWVFIGVLGGIAAFGMLGIVMGPLVLAMAASLLDAYMGHRPHVRNAAE
jgi:predicted PurR-regulated permease PerM